MADEGRTVFVSSHLLAELAQVVDDVAIIAGGRLVAHEPMAALLAQAGATSLEDVYLGLTTPSVTAAADSTRRKHHEIPDLS